MRDAPLRETLCLVVAMLLLAWPLAILTGTENRPPVGEEVVEGESELVRADVELQWTGELQWVEFWRGEELLVRLDGEEEEFEVGVNPGGERLVVRGEFAGERLQAVRVEIFPDLHEVRGATVWARGQFEELLDMQWHE